MSTKSTDVWTQFRSGIRTHRHKRSTVIFFQQDPAVRLYRIIGGGVKLTKLLPDGRAHILRFYGSGDFFGLPHNMIHTATAETTMESVIESVPLRLIQEARKQQECVQQWVDSMLMQELTYAQTLATVNAQLTAEERFCWFLAEQPSHSQGGSRLVMNKGDIANHLALTNSTVSRLIGRLTQEGSIRLTKGHRPVARYFGPHPVNDTV